VNIYKTKQQIGADYEREVGEKLHAQHLPVLISPMLLRKLGAGQIDVAYLDQNGQEEKIVLVEIKKNRQYFSQNQYRRLGQAQELIAAVFEKDVVLRLV
jgi:hypothetical protein